jgi:hypothetical protein
MRSNDHFPYKPTRLVGAQTTRKDQRRGAGGTNGTNGTNGTDAQDEAWAWCTDPPKGWRNGEAR